MDLVSTKRKNRHGDSISINPEIIKLSHILTREQVINSLRAFCEGYSTFAGIFTYENEDAKLVNDTYGDTPPDYLREIISVATTIRENETEADIYLPENHIIAGYPILLHHNGKSYLKGCLVLHPPQTQVDQINAVKQVVKLIANLFSERISTNFESCIVKQNYTALEQELKAQNGTVASIIDHIGGGLLLVDRDYRIIWGNAVMARLYRTDKLEGQTCYIIAQDNDNPCPGCMVKATFESGQAQTGQRTIDVPGLGIRHYAVTTTPVFDKNGEVKQVLELIHDITAMRVAESELSRYKRLVDSSEDLMVITDEYGKIIAVNRKATRVLGYREENLIGQTALNFTIKSELHKAWKIIERAEAVGMAMDNIHIVKRDGSIIPTHVFVTYDSDHKIYECIFRDISERLQMEEKVHKSYKELQAQNAKVLAAIEEKQRFFRSISHELRTPLTSVIAFSELLIEDTDEPLTSRQKMALERVVGNAYKLLSLVNDLLDLSKLEVHKMTVELTSVKLDRFLTQLIDNMVPLARDRNIAVKLSIPPNMPDIYTDEQKLGQILLNLLSNAIKFTREGSVNIAVLKNGKSISISVTDTGVGISPDDIKDIFREFYQGSKRGKGQRGTGLGLAIAQKLAILLGGKLTVESTEGIGSTFTLSLPVEFVNSQNVNNFNS